MGPTLHHVQYIHMYCARLGGFKIEWALVESRGTYHNAFGDRLSASVRGDRRAEACLWYYITCRLLGTNIVFLRCMPFFFLP